MGDTKTDLVQDLEVKTPSPYRDDLIRRAKAGMYHDFDSELVAPKIALAAELSDGGYTDLAQKVIDGQYDDEFPTAEQEDEMRERLGPSVFAAIMGVPVEGDEN